MSALTHDQMVAEINSGHTVTYRGTKITDADDVPSDNQIATDTALALRTIATQSPVGVIIVPPTVDPHIAGALWSNAGTPTISAG